jgi:hypothetical protein
VHIAGMPISKLWKWALCCWLVFYPIAAFMFIFDSAVHWSEKHPMMAAGVLVCWLGPLLAAFLSSRKVGT